MRILVAGPLENPVSNVHFICQTFEKLGHEIDKFDYRAIAKSEGSDVMHSSSSCFTHHRSLFLTAGSRPSLHQRFTVALRIPSSEAASEVEIRLDSLCRCTGGRAASFWLV